MSSCCCSVFSEIWSQFKLVRYELCTILFILIPVSIPLTIDAQLQEDTYGKDRFYLISGCLSTLQGIINVIAGVFIGAISDFTGRTKPVLFCVVLVSIAPLLVVLTENYWVYYVARSITAWYGPAFSVIVASIIDKFRRKEEEEIAEVVFAGGDIVVDDDNDGTPSINNDNDDARETADTNENSDSNKRTKTTAGRIGSLSIAVLVFVFALLVGSGIGTAISNKRHKFIVQLCFCIFAILWVFFVGVSNKPTVTQEQNSNNTNTDADDGENNQSRNENETAALLPNDDAQNNYITTTGTRSSMANSIKNGDQLAHAQNTREKIIKMLKNKNLLIICAIVFMDFLAEQALQSLMLLYVKDQLNMDSQDQEIILFVFGTASVFALLFSVRVLSHYFSLMKCLRLSLCVNALSVILFGLADKKWQLFAIPILGTVGVLVFPLMNSTSSLVVVDEDAGAAQGCVTAARFFAEGVSPAVFGIFLQKMKGSPWPWAGSPFLVAGLCPLIGFLLSFLLPSDIGEEKMLLNNSKNKQVSNKK